MTWEMLMNYNVCFMPARNIASEEVYKMVIWNFKLDITPKDILLFLTFCKNTIGSFTNHLCSG